MLKFTVRELFLSVAVVGLCIALWANRSQARSLRDEHDELRWRFGTVVSVLAQHGTTIEASRPYHIRISHFQEPEESDGWSIMLGSYHCGGQQSRWNFFK